MSGGLGRAMPGGQGHADRPLTIERERSGEAACCSVVYGSPIAELIVGESLHPGGLASTRQLLAASGLQPGARLLDAGCGLGPSSRLAAGEFGLHVDGADASEGVIARAASRDGPARIHWRVADLLDLPFRAAEFDGILAECVLSTMPRERALDELRRVIRPSGCLLLSDVEVGDDPIPALTDHRLLGAALCVSDAWRTGELERRLPAAAFSLERRWDRTEAILALVDRVEARVGMAAIAARDMGIDLNVLAGTDGSDLAGALRPGGLGHLADEVRAAVRRGDLRYFTAVARAGPVSA